MIIIIRFGIEPCFYKTIISAEGVAPPSASSFTGPTENSPGFREDADNVSTTSSMETEWIEVDQPDGKFYFNRYTKEVRKELPTGR